MSTVIPDPKPLLKKTLTKLNEAGFQIKKTIGRYFPPGMLDFDSRTQEWEQFIDILLSCQGNSSVVLSVFKSNFDRPEGRPPLLHSPVRELYAYLRTLPLKCRPDTKLDMFKQLGCYEMANVAIPAIVEVLRRPPPDKCPSAASLGPDACSCQLVILFKNTMFIVAVYQT